MDLGLQGKVALVGGASAGLGKAIAAELVSEGATVAISSRSRERIETAAAGIGAHPYVWDSSDLDGAPGLLARVSEELGPVEVLVTNTGGPAPGTSFPLEEWEAAYRALVLAPLALVDGVLPGMRGRGFGRIVAVSSTSVREPIPGLMLSNSHRAALLTAFKTIAREVAADGVTLNTLLPGSFATARVLDGSTEEEVAEEAAKSPLGRLGEPAELAAAAAFLCSTRASFVTGEALAVDGGKTRSVF